MNGFEKVFASDIRSDLLGSRVLEWDHFDEMKPVHPAEKPALERAHGAVAIEKKDVFFSLHDSRFSLVSDPLFQYSSGFCGYGVSCLIFVFAGHNEIPTVVAS